MKLKEIRENSRVTTYDFIVANEYNCYLINYSDIGLKEIVDLLKTFADHIDFDTSLG